MKPCPSGNCDCFLYCIIRSERRIRKQVFEANGTDNRNFFRQNCPDEEPTISNLFLYYATHGGGSGFAERERESQVLSFGPAI
jgi:hypothetical protein